MREHQQLPPVPRGTLLSESWRFFKNCLAKENYSRMQGRAGLMEYWSATIIGTFITCVPLLFLVIDCYLVRCVSLLLLLSIVFYLALPLLAVFVRRLHDHGFSGWWIVILYVTYCVPFTYITFTIAVRIGIEPELCYNIDELFHVCVELLMQNWVLCTCAVAEFLSIFLFILTLLPGNKGFNKYDA